MKWHPNSFYRAHQVPHSLGSTSLFCLIATNLCQPHWIFYLFFWNLRFFFLHLHPCIHYFLSLLSLINSHSTSRWNIISVPTPWPPPPTRKKNLATPLLYFLWEHLVHCYVICIQVSVSLYRPWCLWGQGSTSLLPCLWLSSCFIGGPQKGFTEYLKSIQ